MAKKKISWKQKKRFNILAPDSFNFQEVGVTFANNSDSLIGRTVVVSLASLNNDRSKQNMKLRFEITGVLGEDKAKTKFRTFKLDKNYVRSKVRKGMKKIDSVTIIELSDAKVWVKVVAVTQKATQTSRIKEISGRISKTLKSHKNLKLKEFLQMALFGKLGTGIYHEVKKVTPIRRVEVEAIKSL